MDEDGWAEVEDGGNEVLEAGRLAAVLLPALNDVAPALLPGPLVPMRLLVDDDPDTTRDVPEMVLVDVINTLPLLPEAAVPGVLLQYPVAGSHTAPAGQSAVSRHATAVTHPAVVAVTAQTHNQSAVSLMCRPQDASNTRTLRRRCPST